MFADTFGVLSRTMASVTRSLPLLVITHLLQLLLQKQFSQLLQLLLHKQFLIKPNLLKYLTIKCLKNVEFTTRFTESLTTVQYHYCRAKHRDRKFVEPGTTLQNLYREYRKQTTSAEIHCVSYPLFDKAMKDCNINITIFLPKKEQCDKCLSAKEGHKIRVYLFLLIQDTRYKIQDSLFQANCP